MNSSKQSENNLHELQDSQYGFPYHHLAGFDQTGVFRLHRQLEWGLEYMTYITHVVEIIEQRKPPTMLDVGCGDGRLLHMIQDLVPKLCGVDTSTKAIGLARAINPDIEFVCARMEAIEERYAVISAIEVLEHIPENAVPDFVKALCSKIVEGGFLILSVPTLNTPLHEKHYRHYSFESLGQALAPDFEIVEHWWLYRRNLVEKFLRRILCNRVFTLNVTMGRDLVWRLHKWRNYFASPSDGAHLVCIAEPLNKR